MEHYAGIDVSLESASVCVVDAAGRIVREAKIASEPGALVGWFHRLGVELARIGLEAGPLSQWLYAGMRLAIRAGMRKMALARKLAVVLHRMLADETEFRADKAATA